MAIRICSNGHFTGFRTCSQCGTQKVTPVVGEGRVLMPRWQLRKIRRAEAKQAQRVAAFVARTPNVRPIRNDTPYLQSIIDQAASGSVVLPAGRFNVYECLVAPECVHTVVSADRTTLVGQGGGDALLHMQRRSGGIRIEGVCFCLSGVPGDCLLWFS